MVSEQTMQFFFGYSVSYIAELAIGKSSIESIDNFIVRLHNALQLRLACILSKEGLGYYKFR